MRLEREDGLPRIIVRRFADGAEHAIAFDEEAYSLGISAGFEFDTTTAALHLLVDDDAGPGVRLRHGGAHAHPAQDPGGAERPRPGRLRDAPRCYAPAPDGETVPVSLLYKKGTPLDGSAPLFLYGYGAYGIAIPAGFSTSRLVLVDRGFIFAIAHIRGGKDKGYRWYTEGKREKKLNTFTDFIAAGEFLAREGYTRRGRIVANGGSAGGMLMGVVANMAPELFLGIIADVPFVDVLNTMLDESLPLTPPEWPEWGNPIASKTGVRYHPLLLALRQRGGQAPTRTSSPTPASPTRASPTGSRPSGSRACATSIRART